MTDTCATCIFYRDTAPPTCHRYPPTTILLGASLIRVFPEVETDEWCGEFKKLPEKKPTITLDQFRTLPLSDMPLSNRAKHELDSAFLRSGGLIIKGFPDAVRCRLISEQVRKEVIEMIKAYGFKAEDMQ